MSRVAAYITYRLLNFDGVGHQPIQQVMACGMSLEGGYYTKEGRYMGYLVGDVGKVAETVAALAAWDAQELTESEAKAWSETVLPVNTVDLEGKYVGRARADSNGRIERPLSASIVVVL